MSRTCSASGLLLLALTGLLPVGAGAAGDTAPPTLRILSPAPDTEVAGEHLAVEIEYSDAGSGIAQQTLHVFLNGKDYAGQFDQHTKGASGRIRLPKSMPIGESRLAIEIADGAGNVARVETSFVYAGPPEAHYNAGIAHAKAGRWKEAAASFTKAVQFNPKDSAALIQLGHAYRHLHRLDEAMRAYQHAIELRPDHLEALLSLVEALILKKDYAAALQWSQRAADMSPKSAQALKLLGAASRYNRQYPEARKALTAARLINPADADIYTQLGLIELDEQHYLQAELNFRRAVLSNPTSSSAHLGLGEAYLHQGRHDKSIQAFTEALKIDPQIAKARFGLGLAYLGLKDLSNAQEQISLLAELDKELAEELRRRLKE